MSIKLIPLIVVASLAIGQQPNSSVRQQESALTNALKSKDKAALLGLLDTDFHARLSCGSFARGYSTDISRQDWAEGVSKSATGTYQAKISNVIVADEQHTEQLSLAMATVIVDEIWTIRASNGDHLLRNFSTTDTWIKHEGTWKLLMRNSETTQPCTDTPGVHAVPLRFDRK